MAGDSAQRSTHRSGNPGRYVGHASATALPGARSFKDEARANQLATGGASNPGGYRTRVQAVVVAPVAPAGKKAPQTRSTVVASPRKGAGTREGGDGGERNQPRFARTTTTNENADPIPALLNGWDDWEGVKDESQPGSRPASPTDRSDTGDALEQMGESDGIARETDLLCPCIVHHEATLALGATGDGRMHIVCTALDTYRGHLLLSNGPTLFLWEFDAYEKIATHRAAHDPVQRFVEERLHGGYHVERQEWANDVGAIAHRTKLRKELGEDKARFALYSTYHDCFIIVKGKSCITALSAIDQEKKLLAAVAVTSTGDRAILSLTKVATPKYGELIITSEVGGVVRLFVLCKASTSSEDGPKSKMTFKCERELVSAPHLWLHSLGTNSAPDTIVYAACGTGLASWTIVRSDGEFGDSTPAIYANELHNLPVTCVGYIHDTRRYATGSWDRSIRIWDFSIDHSPTIVGHMINHSGPVTSISVSFFYNCARMVSTSGDGTVRVWDLEHGLELDRLRLREGQGISSDAIDAQHGNPGLTPWLEDKGERMRLATPSSVSLLCDRHLSEMGLGFSLNTSDADDHGLSFLTACAERLVVCRVYPVSSHLFTGPSKIKRIGALHSNHLISAGAFGAATGRMMLALTQESTIQFIDEVGGLLSRIVVPETQMMEGGSDSDTEIEQSREPRPPSAPRSPNRRGRSISSARRHRNVTNANVRVHHAANHHKHHGVYITICIAVPDINRLFVGFSNGSLEVFDLASTERLTTLIRPSRSEHAISSLAIVDVPFPQSRAGGGPPLTSLGGLQRSGGLTRISSGTAETFSPRSSGPPRKDSRPSGTPTRRGSEITSSRRRSSLLSAAKSIDLMPSEPSIDRDSESSVVYGKTQREDYPYVGAGTKDGYLIFCSATAQKMRERTEKRLAHDGEIVSVQTMCNGKNDTMQSRMLATMGKSDGVRIWHVIFGEQDAEATNEEGEGVSIALMPICYCRTEGEVPLSMLYVQRKENRPQTIELVTGSPTGDLHSFELGKVFDHRLLAKASGAQKDLARTNSVSFQSRRLSAMSRNSRGSLSKGLPTVVAAESPAYRTHDISAPSYSMIAHAHAVIRILGPCPVQERQYLVTQSLDDVVLVWRWGFNNHIGGSTYGQADSQVVHKYQFRVTPHDIYIPRQTNDEAVSQPDAAGLSFGQNTIMNLQRAGESSKTGAKEVWSSLTKRINDRLDSFRIIVAHADTLLEVPGLPPPRKPSRFTAEYPGDPRKTGASDSIADQIKHEEQLKTSLNFNKERLAGMGIDSTETQVMSRTEVFRRTFMNRDHPRAQRLMKKIIAIEVAAGVREDIKTTEDDMPARTAKKTRKDKRKSTVRHVPMLDLNDDFFHRATVTDDLDVRSYRETPAERLREQLMVPLSARDSLVTGVLSSDVRSSTHPQWRDVLEATRTDKLAVTKRPKKLKQKDFSRHGYIAGKMLEERNRLKQAKKRGVPNPTWTIVTSRQQLPPLGYLLDEAAALQ